MKRFIFIILFLLSYQVKAQETFVLKEVNTQKFKQQFEKSNYQMNVILTYLQENYKATSEKLNIQLDSDFNNEECGFTMKFEYGIEYTYRNCGEAKPVEEVIVFPRIEKPRLQKWIENINSIYPMDIKNVWYQGENEYGPESEEAGCYYKMLTSDKNVTVETWCGS